MASFVHLIDQRRLIGPGGSTVAGDIYFYCTGTSVLAPIYQDANLTIPSTNPVSVGAGEIVPEIFLDTDIIYRRVIQYSDGSFDEQDPIGSLFSEGEIGVPVGTVMDYSGSVAPDGFLFCYGQELVRETYPELFAAIGTTYGSGNGVTTFNIPDYRGRVGAGKDNMGGVAASRLAISIAGSTLGATGGEEEHILTEDELASHTHGITDPGHTHGKTIGTLTGPSGPTTVEEGQAAPNWTLETNTVSTGITVNSTGAGDGHNNVQPSIIVNKIIKVTPVSFISLLNIAPDFTNKANAEAIGISPTALNMGIFDGSLIPDNISAKEAIQVLEDSAEDIINNGSNEIIFDATVNYTNGTIGSKLNQFINVLDFGAVGDGVTDDSAAFIAAYNAVTNGGTIKVPYLSAAGYFLGTDPDNESKIVHWDFDNNVVLSGAGIGSPGTGAGTFASPKTNPWLRIAAIQRQMNLGPLRSPPGGAVVGDSWEFFGIDNDDTIAITGTLTNGSAVITAVASTVGIYPGDGVLSAIGGWPSGTTRSNTMRVISVTSNSITVGLDNGGGSGTATPTNWAGSTTTDVSFTVRRRHWMAGRYEGADTGTGDNIDVHYEIANPVMNITGSAGVMYEYNLNSYAITSDFCRAFLITGGGTIQNTKLVGIDIQRGGTVQWSTGISLRNSQVGLFTNAKFPVQIDTVYNNNNTGLTETIGYGIHFDNIGTTPRGGLLEGKQLTNGSSAIRLTRNTDSSPGGRYIQCYDATESNELFLVPADGSILTYAPASSNGSTTSSGSIQCNGITLRGGTNIQLGQLEETATKAATGKYIKFYDETGAVVYVPTYS